MDVTIPYRFKVLANTAAALAADPGIPRERELVFETDKGRFKIGDGTTAYGSLQYANVGFIDFTGISDGDVVVWDAANSRFKVAELTASATSYDNTASGLNATDTQDAIDEVVSWLRPGGVVVLTDGATIALDAALSDNFRVVLGGNRTLGNPTNLTDGQTFNIRIHQDATGGRTLAYASKWKFAGGTAPALSTAASARDFLSCQYDATDDTINAVLNKAFA